MDKDLDELCNIPVKILLKDSKYKQFFTQEEYEKHYGILEIIAGNRRKIEKKLEDAKKAK